jgi:hypothetical protein
MKKIVNLPFLIWGYMLVAWIVNIVKLVNCDFTGPVWKEEIIHAVGLVPGVSMITCWF